MSSIKLCLILLWYCLEYYSDFLSLQNVQLWSRIFHPNCSMLSCDLSFLEPAIILSFLLHMSNKVLSSVFLHLRMSTLCPHVHFYLNIKVTPYTDELPICFGFYNLFFFFLHTTSCLKCIYLQEVHFLSFCIKFFVCVCVCTHVQLKMIAIPFIFSMFIMDHNLMLFPQLLSCSIHSVYSAQKFCCI